MRGRNHESADPSSPGPAHCPGSASPVRGKSWGSLVSRFRTRLRSPADPPLSLCPSHPRQQQEPHPLPHPGRSGAAPRRPRPCPAPLRSAPRTHRLGRGVPAAAACPRPRHRAGRRSEQRRDWVRVRLGRRAGASERRPRRRLPPALPAEGGAAASRSKPRGSAGMPRGPRAGLARKEEAKINRRGEKLSEK